MMFIRFEDVILVMSLQPVAKILETLVPYLDINGLSMIDLVPEKIVSNMRPCSKLEETS